VTTPIAAGIDGSEESLGAVEWAALEAVRRRVPLCIVHVVDHHRGPAAPAPQLRQDLMAGWFRHDLPHRCRSALTKARHRAAEAAPGVEVRAAAVFGRADQVLTAVSARAPLLVIGIRGAGGFSGLRLGSVALRLASRARCPVVFATADSRPVFHEIVVGTGNSDHAAAALEFGFGEADMRGARLTALNAWTHPQAGWPDNNDHWLLSVGQPNEGAAALLSEQVAPWRDKYPDVEVTESTVHGHAGRVLALASSRADLVVVGGRRGEAEAVPGLGPVSYTMLRHAHCPVALIPRT
jgi:nucleotide-binding universal stress UspA family protein